MCFSAENVACWAAICLSAGYAASWLMCVFWFAGSVGGRCCWLTVWFRLRLRFVFWISSVLAYLWCKRGLCMWNKNAALLRWIHAFTC
jgi:hypothetical protein